MEGQVLNNSYRIIRLIGKGGMSAVYEAVNVRLTQKRFAIKILDSSMAADHQNYMRFRREAEIVSQLGHPHIVDVIDFNETQEGEPYIVMEFLEGEDLSNRLKRCVQLGLAEVSEIVVQTSSALQAAHSRGIVHRDVKPDNIFLVGAFDSPVQVKLLDFGISKIRHSETINTRVSSLLGTLYYMSPEQALGQIQEIDQATDIFALGIICYQALSGRRPFTGGSVGAIIDQICRHEPPPVTEIVPSLPRAINEVLARAMAKNKTDRYSNVETLCDELVAICKQHPATAKEGSASGVLVAQPGLPLAGSSPPDPPSTWDGGASPLPVRTAVLADAAAAALDEASAPRTAEEPFGFQQWARTELPAPGVRGKRRLWLLGVFAFGAVLVGAAIVFVPVLLSRPDEATSLSEDHAPRAASPRNDTDEVRIALTIRPAHAQVSLDGVVTRANPLVLARSSQAHTLTVRAAGYQEYQQALRASEDRRVEVKLLPIADEQPGSTMRFTLPTTAPAAAPSPPRPRKKRPHTRQTDPLFNKL